MTIAARLLTLLTVPLAVLVGLGIFTGVQLTRIEAQSRFVAESRIVALATLGNLSRSFSELRVNLRSYLLAGTSAQRAAARMSFDDDERDANRLLQVYGDGFILDERDRHLFEQFQTSSRDWIAGAKEVMSLEDQGRRAESLDLFNGTVSKIGVRLSDVSNEWIAHSRQAATAAGNASIAGIERFERRVFIAAFAALLVSGVLGFVTFRRIVNPIRALDASVNAIAGGDYAKAVPFVAAKDETGGLARSIDVLKQGAASMDEQRWVKSHVSDVTGELQGAASLPEFGQRLLSKLVPTLGGGVASFYVFDEAPAHLQRVAAYGLADATLSAESIRLGEGLVGQSAQERKPVTLTNLPPQYMRIASSLGQAAPAHATALPLLSQDALLGVIELASFRPFTTREQTLLAEVVPIVALSLVILQRNLHTQALLDKTQEQADELTQQTEELQRSQEQLQRTHFLTDTALELTKAGHWHVPLDGSGWYNSSERAARIFGDIPNPEYRYTLDHWSECVREGDEEAWKATMDNFTAAVEGRIPVYSTVYGYKRPVDGNVVWIRALGNVVKDAAGKPTDMFGVTQDITDFKRLERELVGAREKAEEATLMKSMFLANMSHEIRTPMNAIIGLSHLALKTDLSAKQRDYVNKIHTAGTSLLTVINDILDFSKIEAGKLDVEAIDFDLDDVINSVTMVTGQKAHEKGLEFLAHVPPDIPERLIGDPLRLGQILTNLVNNAVKFTDRGDVRVSAEVLDRSGDRAQLKFSISDTGIGMTREQVEKLFQPFTQADMSTTRKHGGTGLGLTISRRLVELMGGRIWVESEAGVGTTFYFTVSLGVGSRTAPRRIVPDKLGMLRVLVVDDNPTAREILQESLSTVARRVDSVASGKEAIAAVREQDGIEPYDILFMDWRMPGLDGLQASRHIKSDETLRHQPAIVLVTAFGREEIRTEAEHLQLDGFLVKPVTKSTLVDTLVNVFAGGEAMEKTQPAEQMRRLRGARILLTEDNEINQQIAIELLESDGAVVTVANNGLEAVEALSRTPDAFDVVLMDLQMPEMDGFQATARLRSDLRFAALPIIAMTAHATIEERQRCLEAGMNDHIPKPIDPEQLIATVARFYKSPAAPVEGGAAVADTRPREDASLPVIDGLDTRDGLTRVGGNRRLYLKLLGDFAEQQGSALEQVREALVRGDIASAQRFAHSLKGVAGNLGATRVQTAAGRLETAIRDQSAASEIETARLQAADALKPLVSQLRRALGSASSDAPEPYVPAAPVDPQRSLEAAAKLTAMLSDFDPGAADFLQGNQTALRPLFDDGRWPQFEKHVLGYAFEDARAELEQAVERSKG